jgi:hypothetical protein
MHVEGQIGNLVQPRVSACHEKENVNIGPQIQDAQPYTRTLNANATTPPNSNMALPQNHKQTPHAPDSQAQAANQKA